MALLPHRRHGNVPQKCSTLLPPTTGGRVQLALETVSSENSSTVLNLQLCSNGFCEMETVSTIKITEDSPSSEKPHRPAKDVAALLKTIRIHPEAQRILGNSCVPVVTLERLRFQFVSHLQPVVSLMRLPCQTQAHLHDNVSCSDPQQNGSSQNGADILEIRAESPQPPRPEESSEISQSEATLPSWTEPYCPEDSPPSGEPEHNSLGFDCESNPDQPYILFESGSEEWDQEFKTDSDTFYLDPDLEQTLVIELNPQPDNNQDGYIDLEDESEATCEVVDIVEMDTAVEYQTIDLCCPQEEEDSPIQQPVPAVETQEMESEDFCAVCLTGGDLLCCDRCPKVYHLACHIPPLIISPLGDWVCTLCRTDLETFHCENTHCCEGVKAPYTLSHQDQRRCEKLTLLLYCHTLSAPFHEPVSRLAQNYYQIIKRPMDLSVIRRKLNESNTLHYFTAQQFVDDVLLMFKNCATFNYPDSEVAQAGRNLEMFFLSKLKEMFPERTFQSTSHERTDRTDRTRCHWLRRKRTEKNRKKRYVFSGKKYYL